jgi:hypothetical protein
MRLFITSLALVVVVVAVGFAITDKNPAAPSGAIVTPDQSNRAAWDLQFSFDVSGPIGSLSNVGAEFDGKSFWTNKWNSADIYEFDIDGNLVKSFTIPGVSGLRDLAYDGEYFYGGAAGGTIWQMDFENETLVSSITGAFECRAIAYNEYDDNFYVKNWGDPIYVVERDGTVSDQFDLVTYTSAYGMAFDNMCGDNYLWIWDQGDGAGFPQYIHQYDLDTGMFTGVQYDVTQDFPAENAISGGLFITSDFVSGTVSIGGLVQTESTDSIPNTMFVYELCDNPIQTSINVHEDFYDPGDLMTYSISVTNTATWAIPIVGWTFVGPPAPPRLPPLFGPVGINFPGGFTYNGDLSYTIPMGAPPGWTFPICINVEGAVDCDNITINP